MTSLKVKTPEAGNENAWKICPRCRSSEIRWRSRFSSWLCRRCGWEWALLKGELKEGVKT